jgi:two-component system response regulator AtoC
MVALGDERLPLNELRAKISERPEVSDADRGSSLRTAARAASRQRERELILEALERTKWNRKRAAKELQVSYKALLYKLKQIGELGKGTVGGGSK